MNLQKQEGIKMAEPKMWQPEGHTWEPNEWQAQNKQPEAEDDIYAEEAVPEKEQSFSSKLPRNILAGLSEAGNETLRAPHGIVSGLERLGEWFNKSDPYWSKHANLDPNRFKFSNIIPEPEEHNYRDLLGLPKQETASDMLIRNLTKYAPEIASGRALYRDLPIALTRRGASRELRQAQHLARERNISNINIPNEIIEDAAHFLPTTRSYQTLLHEAGLGNYDPIFALQSDLGHASRGFSSNPFSFAERRHGREAGRLRNTLLDSFRNELQNQGHHDIADLLARGQQRYRNYQRIKPVRNIGLGIAASQTPYGKKILRALDII
jgi:hypothetical protein